MLKQSSGFTLVELIVVVAIVAILAAVVVPSYSQHVLKTKRQSAKSTLLQVVNKQEQFFLNNKQYATTLTGLGYSDEYYIDGDGSAVAATSDDRTYQITLANATSAAFEVKATPVLNQVKDTDCGTLTAASDGSRTASGSGECW